MMPAEAWRDPSHDPAVERRIHQLGIPLALVLALAVARSGLRGIARTFLTMWVHEIGHALTAWWCGFGAFPGPWRTPISEGRLWYVSVALAGALGYAAFRAWKAEANARCLGLGALLFLQVILTLGLRPRAAEMLFTF